jgi:N-acetylmuramoyl-L-alanine amidase
MSGFFSTPSEMPGAVIEPLYITDPFEASIAASSRGQQVIARGLADAVEQFLSRPAR